MIKSVLLAITFLIRIIIALLLTPSPTTIISTSLLFSNLLARSKKNSETNLLKFEF